MHYQQSFKLFYVDMVLFVRKTLYFCLLKAEKVYDEAIIETLNTDYSYPCCNSTDSSLCKYVKP